MRNGAAWLRGAVDSALAQSGADDQLVLVDDGSRDDPAAVLPCDPRLLLIRTPPRGIASALETGRAACRNPLIARLDADDRALPGRLEAQRAALAADPGLAAVGGRAHLHRDGGPPPPGMARYAAWVNGLVGREAVHRALLVESPLFHPAVTLRAQALDQVGGWRQGDLPEDYDLWLRLVAAGFGLANVPDRVLLMADRPERLTRTDRRYRRAAFETLKREHLAATVLDRPRRLALWGAGRTGRPWLRWLLAQGHQIVAMVDPFVRGSRRGLPVESPEVLVERRFDLLLVAVGARGARALIRDELSRLRPDLGEGRGWLALA